VAARTEGDNNVARMREGRRTAYVEAAVRHAIERVATASEGQRNDTLNSATYALARFIDTGDLVPTEIADALAIAARHAAMPFREVQATIASALRAREAK
jgi:hypothetical protein